VEQMEFSLQNIEVAISNNLHRQKQNKDL